VTVAVTAVNVGGVDPAPAESTSNCNVLEVPTPGVGVCTVIDVIPELAISAAGTCAVSWVALPYVVASAVAIPEIDIDAVRQLAEELGVEFREREYAEVG